MILVRPTFVHPMLSNLSLLTKVCLTQLLFDQSLLDWSLSDMMFVRHEGCRTWCVLDIIFVHPAFIVLKFVQPLFVWPKFVQPKFVWPTFVWPTFVQLSCVWPTFVLSDACRSVAMVEQKLFGMMSCWTRDFRTKAGRTNVGRSIAVRTKNGRTIFVCK